MVASLVLNLGLLGGLGYCLHLLRTQPETSPREQAAAPPAVDPLQMSAPMPAPEVPTRASLKWSQLESSDYPTYIANLRKIGCPEATICDIITADLTKLYNSRKVSLYPGGGEPFTYWHTHEHQRVTPEALAEWQTKAAELDQEKRAVLSDLLGGACDGGRSLTQENADFERRLGFLPEAKREALEILTAKYPSLEEQVEGIVNAGTLNGDLSERQRILDLYNQKRTELAQLLTPAEYEQYELNATWTARNVRNGLAGFNPTEEEFREIFRIWRAQDESLVTIYSTGQPDPGVTAVNAAIQQFLGPERFEQYQRTWGNREMHELATLAMDYQLPEDTPMKIDALRRDVLASQGEITSNALLSPDQRRQALQALREQTTAAINQQLGAAASEKYLSGAGNWLQGMGQPLFHDFH
jgi:hypothetical protein